MTNPATDEVYFQGSPGIVWRGLWAAGTYQAREAVRWDNSDWIAKQVTTVQPSEDAPDDWEYLIDTSGITEYVIDAATNAVAGDRSAVEAALLQALAAQAAAAGSSQSAAAFAAAAGTAVSAVLTSNNIYTTLGAAPTTEGAKFFVLGTGNVFATYYQVISGVQTPLRTLASADLVGGLAGLIEPAPPISYAALGDTFVYDSNAKPLGGWLNGNASDLAPVTVYADPLPAVQITNSGNSLIVYEATGPRTIALPYPITSVAECENNGVSCYKAVATRPFIRGTSCTVYIDRNFTVFFPYAIGVLYVIALWGQSNAVGNRGYDLLRSLCEAIGYCMMIGTTHPPDIRMGVNCGSDTVGSHPPGEAIDPASLTGFIDLYSQIGVTVDHGQTQLESMAFLLHKELYRLIGIKAPFLCFVAGEGGQNYTNMAKGTTIYNNHMKAHTFVAQYAPTLGYTPICLALDTNQGETGATNLASGNMLQLQSDYDADVRAIYTWQTAPIQLMMTAPSSFFDQNEGLTSAGRYKVAQENPSLCTIVGPTYQVGHYQEGPTSAHDGQHSDTQGKDRLGEYDAYAYLNKIVGIRGWTAFGPIPNQTTVSPDGLTYTFQLGFPPLSDHVVEDLTTLGVRTGTVKGMQGVYVDEEYIPSPPTSTFPAITSVGLVNDTNGKATRLQVTLASAPYKQFEFQAGMRGYSTQPTIESEVPRNNYRLNNPELWTFNPSVHQYIWMDHWILRVTPGANPSYVLYG